MNDIDLARLMQTKAKQELRGMMDKTIFEIFGFHAHKLSKNHLKPGCP